MTVRAIWSIILLELGIPKNRINVDEGRFFPHPCRLYVFTLLSDIFILWFWPFQCRPILQRRWEDGRFPIELSLDLTWFCVEKCIWDHYGTHLHRTHNATIRYMENLIFEFCILIWYQQISEKNFSYCLGLTFWPFSIFSAALIVSFPALK